MSLIIDLSLLTDNFLSLILNNLDSWSDSAAFLSHQCIRTSIAISVTRVMQINISGMMPMQPWNELLMIVGMSRVESLMAVGEKSTKTPMRQISSRRINGTTRSSIEGTDAKYFWSSLGPHA